MLWRVHTGFLASASWGEANFERFPHLEGGPEELHGRDCCEGVPDQGAVLCQVRKVVVLYPPKLLPCTSTREKDKAVMDVMDLQAGGDHR